MKIDDHGIIYEVDGYPYPTSRPMSKEELQNYFKFIGSSVIDISLPQMSASSFDFTKTNNFFDLPNNE